MAQNILLPHCTLVKQLRLSTCIITGRMKIISIINYCGREFVIWIKSPSEITMQAPSPAWREEQRGRDHF
jgi:hypothetical protein